MQGEFAPFGGGNGEGWLKALGVGRLDPGSVRLLSPHARGLSSAGRRCAWRLCERRPVPVCRPPHCPGRNTTTYLDESGFLRPSHPNQTLKMIRYRNSSIFNL